MQLMLHVTKKKSGEKTAQISQFNSNERGRGEPFVQRIRNQHSDMSARGVWEVMLEFTIIGGDVGTAKSLVAFLPRSWMHHHHHPLGGWEMHPSLIRWGVGGALRMG